MSQQLAYVIITPYSLHKSRTGGIFARLITRTGLDLVGARLFAPSAELVQKYSELIVSADDTQERHIQELIRDYILKNLSPDAKTGKRRRVMMLLFRGDDAVRKVRAVVGNISAKRTGGETIRDTYGDLILDENGQVRYFEPAVLAAPNAEEAEVKLKLVNRANGNKYECDVIIHLPEQRITAKDTTMNMLAAVDIVEEKLRVQLKKYHDTHKDHRARHNLLRRIKHRLHRPSYDS